MRKVVILTLAMILMILCTAEMMAVNYNYFGTLDYIRSGLPSYGLWSVLSSYRNETSISIYWAVEVSKTVSYTWSLNLYDCNLAGISQSGSTTEYRSESTYVPPRSVSYLKVRKNIRTDAYIYTRWKEWRNDYGEIERIPVYQEDVFQTYNWSDYTFTQSSI